MELSGEGRDSLLYSAMEASSDAEMAAGGEGVDVGDDYEGENGGGGDGGDQEETSKLDICVKPLPTEWTNEKHNLYLKSIEASFVDQLYNTMGFNGFEAPRKASIEPKTHSRSNVRTSAGQFKTLRGGYWQKINVGKREHQSDGQNEPADALLSNPWIRHYRHLERRHLLESSVCQTKAAAVDQEMNSTRNAALPYRFNRTLKKSCVNLYDSHPPDNGTEASGQNFIDEDAMGTEEKHSTLCSTQREFLEAVIATDGAQ